ncbi:hypothetical protein OG689_12290 [Kitasatospora sp. NBC_00240]|uniref:hypothetical protein n=1 Tax=Kitasatospora sp. NBC_00240 TaxID=2903567 RepID=UPI002256A71B|nr:hypothetical protein [Kitasatospora sp. NBC_00240]MCX5210063.1 hypothetical protein [Kitasatospora sp. NBC_00240]
MTESPVRPGRRVGRRTLGVLALAALALGAAGCQDSPTSSAGAADAAPPAAEGVRAPSAVVDAGLAKGMVLPLQAYMTSYPSRVAIQQAKIRIQQDCMKHLGFAYDPPTPGKYPPPNFDGANMARRYGVSVPEEAEKYGYHLAHESGDPPLVEPDPAAGTALKGSGPKGEKPADSRIPEGGCLGESDRKVGRLDEALVNQLNGDSFERSQSDPAVVDAIARWSTCMKGKGYTATSPLTVTDQLPSRGSGTVTPQEIATATADISCKTESGLVKIWFDFEVAIQNELIAQNQLALAEARDNNTATLKQASSVG